MKTKIVNKDLITLGPVSITLDALKAHRAELANGLDASLRKEAEAKKEVIRMTGAVAGIDVLINKLTTPPSAPVATPPPPASPAPAAATAKPV